MDSAEGSDHVAAGDGNARDLFDEVSERMKLITSKVDSKLYFHKDAMLEYGDMKDVINDLGEQKKKVDQERSRGAGVVARLECLTAAATGGLAAAMEELTDAREKLAQMNHELDKKDEELAGMTEELVAARQKLAKMDEQSKELVAAKKKLAQLDEKNKQQVDARKKPAQMDEKEELVAARKKLEQRNHELDEKNKELEALRMKLQKMETSNAADPGPEEVQTTRKRKFSGHCASRDDDLEVLKEKLIKGFMELMGPRNLGVKEIGKLNEKAFQAACAAKLSPKEAEAAASKLYSAWNKLLDDPSWKPSMIGAVGSDYPDEVIGDDEKLQELRREWGEDLYKSVVDTLVERNEYNFDGTLVYDLWSFKEGRKATLGESIDYLFDQAKKLTV